MGGQLGEVAGLPLAFTQWTSVRIWTETYGLSPMLYKAMRYQVNQRTHGHRNRRLGMPCIPWPHGVGRSSSGHIEQVLSSDFRGAEDRRPRAQDRHHM